MKKHAVITDFGGVIVRTEDPGPRARLAARFGLSYHEINALVFDSPSSRLATLGKLSPEDHWAEVCRSLSLPVDRAAELEREFFAGDSLDQRWVDYLRRLKPGVTIALLSNAWGSLRLQLKAQWGILDAFDQVLISAEVGLAKPDPHIFSLALERTGIPASQALFVDDFSENVAAAASLGIHGVRFASTDQVIADVDAFLRS